MMTLNQLKETIDRLLMRVPHLGAKTVGVQVNEMPVEGTVYDLAPDAQGNVILHVEGLAGAVHQKDSPEVPKANPDLLAQGGQRSYGQAPVGSGSGPALPLGGQRDGDRLAKQADSKSKRVPSDGGTTPAG